MTAQIIELGNVTSLDIPVERVLRKADEANLQSVVVIGYDQDGEEYFASSVAGGPEILWALERAKLRLLRVVDGEE